MTYIDGIVLGNRKTFYDMTANTTDPKEAPDGMTIDTDGNIFLAVFHGSKVLKISPRFDSTRFI